MFKIGDKIRCISDEKYMYVEKGNIYTVKRVNPESYKVKLDIEGCGLSYECKDFELVENTKETVNHPDHYNKGIEAIDYIESWDMNFNIGNAVKYLTRAPYKSDELEDLKKALWYVEREIKRLDK